jgi:hypothetical protein
MKFDNKWYSKFRLSPFVVSTQAKHFVFFLCSFHGLCPFWSVHCWIFSGGKKIGSWKFEGLPRWEFVILQGPYRQNTLGIDHRRVLVSETELYITIQFFEWENSFLSCDVIVVIAINMCLLRYPVADEIGLDGLTSVEYTVLSSRPSVLRAHEFFVGFE